MYLNRSNIICPNHRQGNLLCRLGKPIRSGGALKVTREVISPGEKKPIVLVREIWEQNLRLQGLLNRAENHRIVAKYSLQLLFSNI
ncbi:hypothetical protein CEXT_314771 [Caerostris extrusa]|uniref:Uncharacterized protein n=1 Tax=Caerostris extrusa TaxID=172846 RepID=A0AAV4NSS8_CAEEX|nr:hypothetical protein CEXT_314771 [Caerostris extrusa]